MKIISLQNKSGIPMYKQIVNSIESAICNGILKKGDQLPSLNSIKNNHKVSRDTVLMAFNELKSRGIIHSVVGKGYYVSSEDVLVQQKVFLLFDELNSFKEDLYNSFLENLEENIQVDIFFHHFNQKIFDKLINDNIGDYSYYVIMPANLKETQNTLKNLSKEKVYILDQMPKELSNFPAIYQNFKKNIFNGLSSGINYILKYKKLVLFFSEKKQPQGILNGFVAFCNENNLQHQVLASFENVTPKKGEIYIVLNDKDLIRIIKKSKENQLTLAKDIGIISYNDTLLKEVVEGGITAISTDFNFMGKSLAGMILNKKQVQIENPSNLILRNSI